MAEGEAGGRRGVDQVEELLAAGEEEGLEFFLLVRGEGEIGGELFPDGSDDGEDGKAAKRAHHAIGKRAGAAGGLIEDDGESGEAFFLIRGEDAFKLRAEIRLNGGELFLEGFDLGLKALDGGPELFRVVFAGIAGEWGWTAEAPATLEGVELAQGGHGRGRERLETLSPDADGKTGEENNEGEETDAEDVVHSRSMARVMAAASRHKARLA